MEFSHRTKSNSQKEFRIEQNWFEFDKVQSCKRKPRIEQNRTFDFRILNSKYEVVNCSALPFNLVRFGSGIDLTKKFCVRFRSMADVHSFDWVRLGSMEGLFDFVRCDTPGYIRNIPVIPLTRTQSSGPCLFYFYFCLFRDASLSEIPYFAYTTQKNTQLCRYRGL